MPSIEIDSETYDHLLVTSRLVDESIGDVIRKLVQSRIMGVASSAVSLPIEPVANPVVDFEGEWIPVHKIYKGHRVEGTFNPSTHEIRLSTEPWANKYFSSPTAAAVTVVEHFSGSTRETPNTNGRKFWKVTSTGRNLHSIIGER